MTDDPRSVPPDKTAWIREWQRLNAAVNKARKQTPVDYAEIARLEREKADAYALLCGEVPF